MTKGALVKPDPNALMIRLVVAVRLRQSPEPSPESTAVRVVVR